MNTATQPTAPRGHTAPRGAARTPTPDPGLFGPGSATWRVHNDPAMAVAALQALMLQAVHPLAMAGVEQHSDFRADPWGRLQRTAEYVATVTYGTSREAREAGARVQKVHAGLRGVEPESGQPYTVSDPELLRWVHCAEADSFLAAYRAAGGRPSGAEADRYLAEQTRAAALVGLDPGAVPGSRAEFRRYFAAMRPQLRATAASRRALAFLFSPPFDLSPQASFAAGGGWRLLAGTAFGLLPRWARALYGLPWSAAGTPGVGAGVGVGAATGAIGLRAVISAVPARLRTSPAREEAFRRLGLSGDEPQPVAA